MKLTKKMKRLMSILLAMVLTIGMMAAPVSAEATQSEEPLVKILTLSDYQKWSSSWTDDWATLQTQLKGLVEGAYEAGVDPEYMIFGGDYSCLDSPDLSETGKSQVDSIIRSKWPNLTDDKMLIVQGNHDPAATEGLMPTGAYEYDDFIVYLFNEDDYPSKQGDSSAKAIVENAAAELEEYLLLKVDEGETRPIFICSHTGLHYDIDRTDGNNQYAYKVFDVINEHAKYLDIIFMFGHNHTNGDELVGGSLTCFQKGDTIDVCTETSIANRSGTASVLNFTYMNYGYIGYIGDIYNNNSPYEVTNTLSISELWIYEDRIEVYRYSYDGLLDKYTTYLDRDCYTEPDFGSNYTLSYESNGGTKILSQRTTQSWNTVNRTTPVKNGTDFLYWSTNEDGTGNRYKPGDSIYVSADTTLYAQYSGEDSTGESTVFELTEELQTGETYLLAWNTELYTNDGSRIALTNGGTTNVTTMNASWVSEDGATITIPSDVNTSTYQWGCGAGEGGYTFQNVSAGNYLAYENSVLSFVATSSDSCLWNPVVNSEMTDSRAPEGTVLCNLVPASNKSVFIRYSVGGGQLKIGTKSTSTDTANSDVSIYKMTSGGTQTWHEHEYSEYESDNNATCFTDGTQSRSCECGVVETVALKDSKVDHNYVYGEEIKTDARNHYSACEYCGDLKGEAHYGGTATADKKAECEVCGTEYGDFAVSEKLPYEDVAETDWFYDAVYYNYIAKTMTGMDATHFGPYGNLSRAQFALILYRIEGEPAIDAENPFKDIAGDEWYAKAVIWAQANGIVTGYQSGDFGPADLITREQMAVMMYRYAKYLGQDIAVDGDYSGFADAASVSEFAGEAIGWATDTGIITGKENGTKLDPQGNTARSEAAVIIQRFMNK